MLKMVCEIWLEVSSALAFAWKLRCAAIKLTSSSVMSTFDPSIVLDRIAPYAPSLAVPNLAAPDMPVASQ